MHTIQMTDFWNGLQLKRIHRSKVFSEARSSYSFAWNWVNAWKGSEPISPHSAFHPEVVCLKPIGCGTCFWVIFVQVGKCREHFSARAVWVDFSIFPSHANRGHELFISSKSTSLCDARLVACVVVWNAKHATVLIAHVKNTTANALCRLAKEGKIRKIWEFLILVRTSRRHDDSMMDSNIFYVGEFYWWMRIRISNTICSIRFSTFLHTRVHNVHTLRWSGIRVTIEVEIFFGNLCAFQWKRSQLDLSTTKSPLFF